MPFENPTYGDIEKGYYGTVNGMITNSDLDNAMNMSQGSLLDSAGTDITFHKFIHKGRILYIPNRPIRHSISWDHIQDNDGVKGKVITIGGRKYLVRLMTGSIHYDEGGNSSSVAGGEWTDLFEEFHESNGGPLSDADVYISGDGSWTWCQEVHSSNLARRVRRGSGSVSAFSYNTSSHTISGRGWRPVLEEL